ncbi:hypothetical protein ENH_00051900 [Eimeria necatrix]|uniref:Uncharacterized protein n=1 Tax=Eimeria necatrix TaxID=51315 RepID=U6N0W3_9EIME|nr:hypothetical protein ENH_00051900 [Eimeria necatrix]CDJ68409.1 hypothetical protein ENH_00051900 [Eimeria necatrix]
MDYAHRSAATYPDKNPSAVLKEMPLGRRRELRLAALRDAAELKQRAMLLLRFCLPMLAEDRRSQSALVCGTLAVLQPPSKLQKQPDACKTGCCEAAKEHGGRVANAAAGTAAGAAAVDIAARAAADAAGDAAAGAVADTVVDAAEDAVADPPADAVAAAAADSAAEAAASAVAGAAAGAAATGAADAAADVAAGRSSDIDNQRS